jgi:PAS domain S-box-containing protein
MKNFDQQAFIEIISVFERSKELIESIIDNLAFLVMVVDDKGAIYRINKEMGTLLGCGVEIAAGRNIDLFFDKERVAQISWGLQQLKNGAASKIQFECSLQKPDGPRILLLEAKSLKNEHNLPLFIVAGSDVTDYQNALLQKGQLEQELDFEKKKYLRLSVLASFNDVLVENGFLEAFTRVIGKCVETFEFDEASYYEFNEIQGVLKKTYTLQMSRGIPNLLTHIENKSEEISLHSQTSSFGLAFENRRSEWNLTGKGETSVILFLGFERSSFGFIELRSKTTIPKDDLVFDVLTDVGGRLGTLLHQVELQNQISEKNALLENASKLVALGEISGGIAHEINNPLTIVYGKLRVILNIIKSGVQEPQKIRDQIEQVLKTLDRITAIVRGLKVFSREGQVDQFLPIDIRDVMNNTLPFCEDRYKQGNVTLSVQGDVASKIMGNETQLMQVLVNMLNNAFDAVEQKSERWVSLSVDEDAHHLFIQVTDSGNGISENVAKKIMQPFFTTKEPGKGTGLGLSISFGIIKAHGGELYLNHHHPNTQFVIRLPKT